MSVLLLAGLGLALAVAAVAWLGAGIVLHPPKKSRLSVFPEQFGLRYEPISFTTKDGLLLKGWFLPSPTGDERAVLMCHGWGDNKGELLAQTSFLNSEAGLNLVYFDHRSHGESAGRFTTLGCMEIVDFDAAMEHLRRRRPECLRRLGVYGLSMGAAVAAMAAHAHPEIKAVALESPFCDYRRVVRRWAWNNLRLPYFPLMMLVLWTLRRRAGRDDIDSFSPGRFVERLAPRPLLVIGGADDRLMPPEDMRELYALAREPKELWIVPGARHAKCRESAGADYDRRLADFFLKHL
ncbi:MAG: alpha/beta hydrolase [Elusimicrobia bacterium]|nr:alpha/beta hydrolase [Elusimicrobiota bacterium]